MCRLIVSSQFAEWFIGYRTKIAIDFCYLRCLGATCPWTINGAVTVAYSVNKWRLLAFPCSFALLIPQVFLEQCSGQRWFQTSMLLSETDGQITRHSIDCSPWFAVQWYRHHLPLAIRKTIELFRNKQMMDWMWRVIVKP